MATEGGPGPDTPVRAGRGGARAGARGGTTRVEVMSAMQTPPTSRPRTSPSPTWLTWAGSAPASSASRPRPAGSTAGSTARASTGSRSRNASATPGASATGSPSSRTTRARPVTAASATASSRRSPPRRAAARRCGRRSARGRRRRGRGRRRLRRVGDVLERVGSTTRTRSTFAAYIALERRTRRPGGSRDDFSPDTGDFCRATAGAAATGTTGAAFPLAEPSAAPDAPLAAGAERRRRAPRAARLPGRS